MDKEKLTNLLKAYRELHVEMPNEVKEITDAFLQIIDENDTLQQENKQLKENWNKLKEHYNKFRESIKFETWEILDEMQYIEKGDSNE